MEKSVIDPNLNKDVGEWLYEDSKWREKELEHIKYQLDQKAKVEASWGVASVSSNELVNRLYEDQQKQKEKQEKIK